MSCKCSTVGKPCNGCLCCTPIGVTNLTTCEPPDPCEGNYYDICCIDPPPIPCLTVDPDKNFCEILVDILDELTERCDCACKCYKVTNLSNTVWRRNYFTCDIDGANTLVEAVVDVNQQKYFYGCINLKPSNIPAGVTIEEIESDDCRELANCETCFVYTITNNTNTDWTRISTGCDGDGNYVQTFTVGAGEIKEICSCVDILPVVPIPGITITIGDEACDSPLCDFEVTVDLSTTTTSTTSTTSTSTTTTTTLPCYCLEVFGKDGDILQVKNCDGSQIELPFVGTPSVTSPYVGIPSMLRCAYDIAVDIVPFIYSHGKCVVGGPCLTTTTSSTTTTTTSNCSFEAEIEVIYPTTTTTSSTTTTSTTTTTTLACNCYKVLNPGNSLETVTWVGCNPDLPGYNQTNIEEMSPGEIKFICSIFQDVLITDGLFVDPQGTCTTGCIPPTSYCYEVGATGGDINIRFVDYNNIITTMMIADGTTEIICAWEDSIEQYAGTGTIVTPIQGASCTSPCVTTTTTISCHCHTIDAGDATDFVINYTDCAGSDVTIVSTAIDLIKSPYSFCARLGSVETDLNTMVITIGDTCNNNNDCLDCNCFTISNISKISEYEYTDCNGDVITGTVDFFNPLQVCGYFNTVVANLNTVYELNSNNCTLVGSEYLCNYTTTTSTSTTTTTTQAPCNCYYISVPSGRLITSLTYLGCDGQVGSVGAGSFGTYCIQSIIDYGDGVAYFTGNLCERTNLVPIDGAPNYPFECPKTRCDCYILEVPSGGVNDLIYVNCNNELGTVSPGESINDCVKYIITEGDGSATLIDNCIENAVKGEPSTFSCPTVDVVQPISCVTYSFGDYQAFEYDVDTNTSTPFDIPGNYLTEFAETHTNYKYWKGQQGQVPDPPLILEWLKTDNSGVLTFVRQIDINLGVFYNNRYAQLFAIDNNTLLTTAITPGGTYLFRMDITNNPITSADVTPLFPILTEGIGVESFFLTSTNKIIAIIRKDMSSINVRGNAHLVQYDYLTGVLEVDIDLTGSISIEPVQVYTFSVNGKIYVSEQFPYPLSNIWEVDLNDPFTLTPVGSSLGLFGNVLNSKYNCNTVELGTSTTTTTTAAPPSEINTIYTYFTTY